MKRKLLGLLAVSGGLAVLVAATHPPSREEGNPLVRYALQGAARSTLRGHVEERVPAGGYLYLRVRDTAGADHWVATLRATAPSTPEVEVRTLARAERFASPRLGRTFAPLLFGAVQAAHPTHSP